MAHSEMTPDQVKDKIDNGEYVYVDVRSAAEFEQGHAAGAHNVPLLDVNPQTGQMEPNPDFERVIVETYPKDARLVLGCASGNRSRTACQILAPHGFEELVNLHGGFSGARDLSGRVIQEGWRDLGYPCAAGEDGGVTYQSILRRIREG